MLLHLNHFVFDFTNVKCNYLFISSVFVLLSITYNLFPFVQDDLDEHVDVTDSRLRVRSSFMYFKINVSGC